MPGPAQPRPASPRERYLARGQCLVYPPPAIPRVPCSNAALGDYRLTPARGQNHSVINDLIANAIKVPGGRFAYLAPFRGQAKTVAWDYLKQFTQGLTAKEPNETELRIDLRNGSRITLFGADNSDALRGVGLDGVILDEFADMAPSVWSEVVRPALSDREGFATLIGTPRGRNSFHAAYTGAVADPGRWYSLMLKASESGILPAEELEDARRSMTPEHFSQEYEADFAASIVGSYYGAQISELQSIGRIKSVSTEPSLPIHTAWDLGIGDSTSIWAFQVAPGPELRILGNYTNHGQILSHYVAELEARAWVGGDDWLPADAKVRSLDTGKTRVETLTRLGRNPRLVPDHSIEDGINAVRLLLPLCWFDAEGCHEALEGLRQYSRVFDEKKKVFSNTPKHDWCSDIADAFRYLAMAWREIRPPKLENRRPLFKPLSEMSIDEYDDCPTGDIVTAEGIRWAKIRPRPPRQTGPGRA